jgi:acetyl esterase/lipase
MTTRAYLDTTPPAGLRIRYGREPAQFGDLRVPAGSGPHPVVVVIHGGWWRAQYGLTYAGHLSEALTADGLATWNIEYRRGGEPGGGFPGTLEDVAAALVALRALAPEYHLDLARIVVTGHSAGGHLAAWLAAKPAHRALDVFGESLPIAGAVPVAGVLDLVRTSELRIGDDGGGIPVVDFLAGSHDEIPDRYALACPASLLPAGVPVVAVHGTADVNVPLELSERYVERARAAGDPATLIALPDVDHFEPFDPGTPAGGVVRRAIAGLIAQATPPQQRGFQPS